MLREILVRADHEVEYVASRTSESSVLNIRRADKPRGPTALRGHLSNSLPLQALAAADDLASRRVYDGTQSLTLEP